MRDAWGKLYLCVHDTDIDHLEVAGIEAARIALFMDNTPSNLQILILDCCHSGAVFKNTRSNDIIKQPVGLKEYVLGRGYGRAILTSCDSFQFAFDGTSGKIEGEDINSAYSKFLIEGLKYGEADLDKNGEITVEEIHHYIETRMRSSETYQNPQLWTHKSLGQLVISNYQREKPIPNRGVCFVISPLRDTRSDDVYNSLIVPACVRLGYKPQRSDKGYSPSIMGSIVKSLKKAPMVIAYLGIPPWNPNVMIEVGYRLATGRPIILLREDPQKYDGSELPFDLRDHRVFELRDINLENSRSVEVRAQIKEIAKMMEARANTMSIWETTHPIITVLINPITGEGYIDNLSMQAKEIFLPDSPDIEIPLDVFVDNLKSRMPKRQYEAFLEEQLKLMQQITCSRIRFGEVTSTKDLPHARIPIVFRHNEDVCPGIALLPIVFQYSQQGGEIRFQVIYLNVSDVVKVIEGNSSEEDYKLTVCELDMHKLGVCY